MRWKNRRLSDNLVDRRTDNSLQGAEFSLPKGKLGLAIIILILVASYYGIDLTPLISQSAPIKLQQPVNSDQDNELANFTSIILATTEDTWSTIFEKMGKHYQEPKLVLYRQATETGCGLGQAVMGPFYCPVDSTIYIDLSFYAEMKARFGAGGDFAQGYIIAHEVGHHVQKLLGITEQVRALQQGQNQTIKNKLSVKLELQADCLAGIWGQSMENQHILDPSDLPEALNAAKAIGDDRLQQQTQGKIIPDSFTHGTSAQRYQWFKIGFETGSITHCNTFK